MTSVAFLVGVKLMNIPSYEIFSGFGYKDAEWIEAVPGLGAAVDRMRQLAEEKPGPYFVFCVKSGTVLDSVDTSKPRAQRASA
jgi:hypothetical protein